MLRLLQRVSAVWWSSQLVVMYSMRHSVVISELVLTSIDQLLSTFKYIYSSNDVHVHYVHVQQGF